MPIDMRRPTAAAYIQRKYRLRLKRKGFYKSKTYKKKRSFARKVNNAQLSYDPQQYYLRSIMNNTAVTQAPTTYDLVGLYYDVSNSAIPNPKFWRSSNKIMVQNMQLNFRVNASTDTYNKVSIMLVRHKRSEPILNTDIQDNVGGGSGTIPLLTANDVPFLPTMGDNPSSANFNFRFGTAAVADPESLYHFTNPKVVDVIWQKHVMVQPKSSRTAGQTAPFDTYPSGFTFQKHFTHNQKLNEIWKYPQPPEGTTGNSVYPYNNKCYSIICTSDSLSTSADHPTVDCTMRLSFKDLD